MSSFESGTPLDKARADEGFTSFDQRVAQVLEKPIVQILLLNAFKEYMVQYLALNQPPLSISQVFGFSQFAVSVARNAGLETVTSATYVAVTDGPVITGLPDGNYAILLGSNLYTSAAGNAAFYGVKVNDTLPADDTESVGNASTTGVPGATVITKSLSAGANTLTSVGRIQTFGQTASFEYSWLAAFKYSNP